MSSDTGQTDTTPFTIYWGCAGCTEVPCRVPQNHDILYVFCISFCFTLLLMFTKLLYFHFHFYISMIHTKL